MEVHGKFCPLKEDYFTVFWIIITKANTLFSKITSLNNATTSGKATEVKSGSSLAINETHCHRGILTYIKCN